MVLVRAAVAVALALAMVVPADASAGETDGLTTSTLPESGGIIPAPNSGVAPADAGDRGGVLQTLLFVVMLGGVGVIGGLVVRESRARRSERGF